MTEKRLENLIIVLGIVIGLLFVALILANLNVNPDGKGEISQLYFAREDQDIESENYEKFEITISKENFNIVNINQVSEEPEEYDVPSSSENFDEIIKYFRTLNIVSQDSPSINCEDGQIFEIRVDGQNPFNGKYYSCEQTGSLSKDPSSIETYIRENFDIRKPAVNTEETDEEIS